MSYNLLEEMLKNITVSLSNPCLNEEQRKKLVEKRDGIIAMLRDAEDIPV